ncbi:MAG: hypothetical protein LBI65_03905 [Candidatus Symbiothrix sp.]|jgi:hypothetical protein|nr:hypothetical protein [Candidatus Symbiothrix sp.]
MNKIQFDNILPLKVQPVIGLLTSREKLPFVEALRYLYSSCLYELLEREETKVWYYSPAMLLELLVEEKQTGHLQLPDHV